jgi:predicted nucleic acid-binding protein
MGLSGVTPLWPSFANFPKAQASSRSRCSASFFNVLVRKAGKSRSEARDALLSWRDTFSVVEASSEAMLTAADLAMDHQLGIWDVVTGCPTRRVPFAFVRGPGFTWAGVTVANPFASPRHALLEALLEEE